MPGKRGIPIERFMNFVEVDVLTGCWHWRGHISPAGYGRFQLGTRRSIEAHRFAYGWFVGEIGDGLVLDHVCHNDDLDCRGGSTCLHRSCVCPDHLDAVTPRINSIRGKGPPGWHHMQTFCSSDTPHPLFGANLYIDGNGHRHCRACRRRSDAAAYLRRRAAHLQGTPVRAWRKKAA